MKREVIIGCCLLTLFSGCIGAMETSPGIDVGISDVSEQQQNGEVRFNGTLEVLDHYGGEFLINDVRVEFVEESGAVMRTVHVGPIHNTSFQRNISIDLAEPPERVLIQTGKIETRATVGIYGMRRNETGGFEYYYQNN